MPEGIFYEGSGETLVWKDKILIGHGFRTNEQAVAYLENYFGNQHQVIGLKLIHPYMYHLDTALLAVSDNLIIYSKDAFDEASLQKIKGFGCELATVEIEDVKQFGLNSVVLGNDVVIHYEAKKMIKLLEQKGYRVHTVDVS